MRAIHPEALSALKRRFLPGTRVELVHMADPYNNKLGPGSQGTVTSVDDIGTIHVNWDCGSSLGVAYGEDCCRIISNPPKSVCNKP